MKKIISLILVFAMLMSTVVFADSENNPKELKAIIIESVNSIDDIRGATYHTKFIVDKSKINKDLLLSGYILDGENPEYIEIKGTVYESYYNNYDLILDSESSNPNWSVEFFASVENTPSEKVLFNSDVSNENSVQIILKNIVTNEVVIIEDIFSKLSQRLSKDSVVKTEDPFLEHWWTRVLQPSEQVTDTDNRLRYLDSDSDSYYSSRYDLGSGYWAEYYIKVEQTSRFYDAPSSGTIQDDTVLEIADENTTTNYWGYDDLDDTPLTVTNVRGEYKISASYGTDINDEFVRTAWGGSYYNYSSLIFSISMSVGKIINASLSYTPVSNIQRDTPYVVPISLAPVSGYKVTFPGYLDNENDNYNLQVVKERTGIKVDDYFMQGAFYFDYSMYNGSGSLASGSTFTIGGYQ